MNLIYLLIGLFFRHVSCFSSYKHEIENFIYSRCKNNTDSEISNEIRKRLNDTYNEFHTELKDDKQNFCADNKNKLSGKMKEITTDMKSCFSNLEERYLPLFMAYGFAHFMEFVCGNRTIEIFFSPQGRDCQDALKTYRDGHEIENCLQELHKMLHRKVLSEEVLCQDLKSSEECFVKAINDGCPHFKAFEALATNLFRSLGMKCNTGWGLQASGAVVAIAAVLSLICDFVN
ncbi:uncharacterized protein LOC123010388 [Tribolium madens]|uniref:uncharacterized protein LOC123010388 n=1 Tax=Tribolium madens TaxID=41895 RepID=UPI001CF75B88|nr:uncharacterized protein LOC123010388 [Tribolium madens]